MHPTQIAGAEHEQQGRDAGECNQQACAASEGPPRIQGEACEFVGICFTSLKYIGGPIATRPRLTRPDRIRNRLCPYPASLATSTWPTRACLSSAHAAAC